MPLSADTPEEKLSGEAMKPHGLATGPCKETIKFSGDRRLYSLVAEGTASQQQQPERKEHLR